MRPKADVYDLGSYYSPIEDGAIFRVRRAASLRQAGGLLDQGGEVARVDFFLQPGCAVLSRDQRGC